MSAGPGRSDTALGTDRFDRSDTRAALRAFLGVDAAHITAATGVFLTKDGGSGRPDRPESRMAGGLASENCQEKSDRICNNTGVRQQGDME